jgi:hypothetical protein
VALLYPCINYLCSVKTTLKFKQSIHSLCTKPLAWSPVQVKLDSDKWKLCKLRLFITFNNVANTNCHGVWDFVLLYLPGTTVFALICFHLLARTPNLEKKSIYSNKFCHNFVIFHKSCKLFYLLSLVFYMFI